jgi:hypothetical protein
MKSWANQKESKAWELYYSAFCEEITEGSYTAYQLGEYFITPIPASGIIKSILRSRFFSKNELGYWVRKNNVEEYMEGCPSSPYWKINVLPVLLELLEEKYGETYKLKYMPGL